MKKEREAGEGGKEREGERKEETMRSSFLK